METPEATSDGVHSNLGNRKRPRVVKRDSEQNDDTAVPAIFSLQDLEILLAPDILQHLASQHGTDRDYTKRLLNAMKRPVATTICRVNFVKATRNEVLEELVNMLPSPQQLNFRESTVFPDVIEITEKHKDNTCGDLSSCSKPRCNPKASSSSLVFHNWPSRQRKGWPMTHKAILCDRFCGEAVLRGSDIFVRGVLAADPGICAGDKVAVYADIPSTINNGNGTAPKGIARGLLLDKYCGSCVFLGLGIMQCSRSEIFSQSNGVALSMSPFRSERVGPLLPSLSGIMVEKMMLQNLPSVMVAHTLNPQAGDIILDMCAAPGGKTCHLASLVKNQAIVIACDRSRKKVVAAKELFEQVGASCVTPLALDSTRCVCDDLTNITSIEKLLANASRDPRDGLKCIKSFPPESFDKILLDPPCSALGLRPKLVVSQQNLRQLDKHALYQRKFVDQSVKLLKRGGFMTYSTCTMNSTENENIVKYILQEYPSMELAPVNVGKMGDGSFGRPGLLGCGLTEAQSAMVRRFDPGDSSQDTMGFFVAHFRKLDPGAATNRRDKSETKR